MQNLILFQTLKVSSDEFVLKGEKNMRNKKTFIGAEEISFCEKIKFLSWKIRRQRRRTKGGDAELNSLSNCHRFK